jgi:DNA-binding SARP family transcriptional activator
MDAAPTFRILLLGPFQVTRDQRDAPIELRRKTCALLAYLAATARPHPRQLLAELFCQETDDPQAALRSVLSRIRQRLGAGALLTSGNTVQLDQALVWVDCLELARHLDASRSSLSSTTLAAGIDLYQGAFLANLSLDDSPEFELWLLNERNRYRALYEWGLETLIAQLIAEDAIEPAISRVQALIQSNPLLEQAHGRLMWLYARRGQREAALHQFEECRRVLQRELAVEPGPELLALHAEIAAGQLRPPRPLSAVVAEVQPRLPQAGDFVGRSAQLAQLQDAWQAAASGHSSLVLIEAPAGMGKTRLVREFAETLPHVDFLVGVCYESTRTLPYSPWLDLLESRVEQRGEESLSRLSALAVEYLARLLPGLARRLRRRPPPTPISGGEVSRLFKAVAELLLELPDRAPLLLFLDNLQWADEASLQLFHFLARQKPPGALLLAGAFRSEEARETPALQVLLGDLQQRPLLHLRLPPLTPQAISQLVARLWPELPEGYRPSVCEMLVRATRGNPLFTAEILRELAGTTQAPVALPVPQSVSNLIERRLAQLPENSRQVVEALAVLDSPATPALAQQVSGRSEDETIAAIDLALRRGLLQAQIEAGAEWYDFSHDLMREVVAGQLSQIRRQLLHRRAALNLEQTGAAAATLAHHWQMAGDAEKEGRFAALAGAQAAALYANDEAVRYLARAVTLAGAPAQRLDLHRRLGEVLQLLGRHPEAETTYRQALALAEAVADRPAQAQCQVALGRLMRLRGDYPQALTWLAQAQAGFQVLDDQPGLMQTLLGMGAIYWSQLDYPRALACFQQQLEIAHRLGDRQGIAAAIGSMGVVYTEQGNYAQALACHTQRLQIDLALNDRLSLAKTIGNMGVVYAEQGEYDHALTCYLCLLRVTLELGDRRALCVAVGNMISVYTELGQYDVAERLTRQAIALGRALNIPLYLCEFLQAGAELFTRQGRYAEARVLNDEAASMAAQIGRTDVQLSALLLSVRLRVVSGAAMPVEAAHELASLRNHWPEDLQQAAILYELWRLDPMQTHHGQRAAVLYGRLSAHTPNITYRQRYQELTGMAPAAPPSLPLPPAAVAGSPVDLEALLAQVDRLIDGMQDGPSRQATGRE